MGDIPGCKRGTQTVIAAVVLTTATAFADEILVNGSFGDGLFGWNSSGCVYVHPEYTISNPAQVIRPTDGNLLGRLSSGYWTICGGIADSAVEVLVPNTAKEAMGRSDLRRTYPPVWPTSSSKGKYCTSTRDCR
jgi:hypothetical protein